MGKAATETKTTAGVPGFDVSRIRRDFPILSREVHGKPLVFLDNAASSQRPEAVIRAVEELYRGYYANVHRGVHLLSETTTTAFESVREKARAFLGAAQVEEVLFVRGTTEAANLVAASYGNRFLGEGDEILLTEMEHHSNIVPWQMLAERIGARIRVIPVKDDGSLDMVAYRGLLGPRTKLVAVGHVSNALGTVNPVREITAEAHRAGAVVFVDGAQAAPHMDIDVRELDCDFYAFSSHKVFGPTGVGVLYGKRQWLEAMPPYQGGGDMIKVVSFKGTTYADLPSKFEAGTPNIAGVIGLGAALDYLSALDRAAARRHEEHLLARTTELLAGVPGLRLVGTAPEKISIVSFVVEGTHPHDVGTLLDQEGIAVRTGHHCAMPLMERFGLPGTVRASFAFYNTGDEVEALHRSLRKVIELLV